MKNIKIFVWGFYQSNFKEFWILISANLITGLILSIYNLHEFIQFAVISILLFKNFSFLRSQSIMPSIASDFDRYSWKYFQGLPLNKEELLTALVLCNLIVMFPTVIWLMSFFSQVSSLFDEGPAKWSFALKIFACLIPLLAFISLTSILNLINFPRRQYSKNSAQSVFFSNLKNYLFIMVAIVYGGISCMILYQVTNINLGYYSLKAIELIFNHIFKTWWMVPALFILALFQFKHTLRVWQVEHKSYKKINWLPKRDVPKMALCLMLIYAPFNLLDLDMPSRYKNSELLKAVYLKDYKSINHQLQAGADINQVNSFGFSPLFVAANEGDLKMFQFLESKGAKHEGTINLGKQDTATGLNVFLLAISGKNAQLVEHLLKKGHNPNQKNEIRNYYAIHMAAASCQTKVLDLLIEHQADLKVLNKDGRTALHSAVRFKCFGSVVSLLDAKINPLIKDNEHKIAQDYLKNGSDTNKEMAYFIEKRTREPAGK